MRAFTAFLGLFCAAFAAVGIFTYPLWLLVSTVHTVAVHRVGSRLGMVVLGVGLVLLARRLRVADRVSLGYGASARYFTRDLVQSLLVGVVTMLPAAAALVLFGLREPLHANTAGTVVTAALAGLATGLSVAFIEETFLRGAMYTAVRRESGKWVAVLGTAVLYAATHFLGRHRIASEDAGWMSGLELLHGALLAFTTPGAILDALACLTVVGVVLALVREITGNIASCIGLHAGWVMVIMATLRLTQINTENPATAWLLATYDGFTGWLVGAWALLLGPGIYLYYRARTRARHRSTGRYDHERRQDRDGGLPPTPAG